MIEELIEQGQYRLMQILRRVRTKYIRLESSCFDKSSCAISIPEKNSKV